MLADSGENVPRGPAKGAAPVGRLAALRLLTIGHSNRTLAAFLGLLAAHRVQAIADVRRHPASRRHPHFSGVALARSLAEAGIDHVHIPELGGMREPLADSPHTALADGPFRGYADHMASAEFAHGLARLERLAAERTTAAMCAEADPAHCHRSLLADTLLARGHTVAHIVDPGPPRPHRLHAGARAEGGAVIYDGAQRRLPL
jgi:uncharacterized protein (DUF488 family)